MQILTPSGYKNLSALEIGDEVIGDGGAVNTLEAIDLWTPETDPDNQGAFDYYLLNGTYKFYKNQSVYVNDTVNHAFMIQVGDKIYDRDHNEIEISSVELIGSETEWYRLKISGDHSYILDEILVHNASRFWVGGGSSANWSATSNTNWSASSGGSGNASVPTSSDDVTFDGAGSGNSASTVSAIITILSLTFSSGYTNTIALNAIITIAGNFTDNTAHSYSGSSGITISAASTITSGNKTFPNAVIFSGATTKTLIGNWVVGGSLTISAATVLNWTTNETLTCNGLTMSAVCSGTAGIILSGGTWSGSSGVGNNITFAGNVTISGSVGLRNGINTTITYSSGIITTSGSGLSTNGGNTITFNTNGMVWNSISIGAVTTLVLNSLLTATTIDTNGSGSITFSGTFGFLVTTLNINFTDSRTITLVNGVTYTIINALNCFLSRNGSIVTFASDNAVIKANLVLQSDSSTCNVLASFTRIDASGGRPIITFNGTITNSLNIISQSNVAYKPTVSFDRGSRRSGMSNKNKTIIFQ